MPNHYRLHLRESVEAAAIDASPLQPAYLDRVGEIEATSIDADGRSVRLGDLFEIERSDDAAVPTLTLSGATAKLHRIAAAADGMRAGMSKGRIVVLGDAGPMAGHRMRRGELLIDGDAGPFLGALMIAGTIAITGGIDGEPLLAAARGTLLHRHPIEAPAERFTRPFPSALQWLNLIDVAELPPALIGLLRPPSMTGTRRRVAAAEAIRPDVGS